VNAFPATKKKFALESPTASKVITELAAILSAAADLYIPGPYVPTGNEPLWPVDNSAVATAVPEDAVRVTASNAVCSEASAAICTVALV
jgi:hypothetical protein